MSLDPWQYRLDKAPGEGAVPLGAFFLHTGSGLHQVALRDGAGKPAGMLLGFPIDLHGKTLLQGRHQLQSTDTGDADAFADAVLREIAGRYVWFDITPTRSRIYPDCGAQVPCVFDPDGQQAGSTAHALFDETAYQARLNTELHKQLRVDVDGYFPAGITAHHGVHRLLPNHYLDLETWQMQRCWAQTPFEPVSDPKAAISEMIDLVRAQIEALGKSDKRIALALTAGRETRSLLSIAKSFIADIDSVTVVGSDRHAVDSIMAEKISTEQGLTHRKLPRVTATDAQRAAYMRLCGHCVIDGTRYAPSVASIADSHYFVGGSGGEIARGFFWQDSDTADLEVTPQRLLSRFGMPDIKELHAPLQTWLDSIPSPSALDVLDLAYIESRVAAWGSAQFCCDPTLVRFAPLLTRRGVELMLGLPDDWKRGELMSSEIVRQSWPALEAYPYNSLGRLRDTWSKLQRVLMEPGVVIRKLRKLRK